MTRQPKTEVYPGSPLYAVAIEVQYKPLLDALSKFGEFQRKHDADYPRVYLPDELTGSLRTRRLATLVNDKQTHAVTVGRDIAAIVTYEYSDGHEGFTQWAVPLLQEVVATISPTRIDAIRYVYENRETVDDKLELRNFFRVVLPTNEEAKDGLKNVHLHWTRDWPSGRTHTRVDCCETSTDGELEVKIVAEFTGPITPGDLKPPIEEAHRMARLTYEDLITDTKRSRLREES